MNISYEQIKAFVAVAETGSFSAAARKLNKHRTTLGQVISNLEIEINMTLFDRSKKFPELTEQGHALFRHAKNLYDSSTAFESLCLTVESGVESDVMIYHTDLLPREVICSVMKDVRASYPHVNVHWLSRNVDEVRVAMRDGEVDLGIVLLDTDSQGASHTDFVHLMSMPFVVIASPQMIASEQTQANVRELKSMRQLLLEAYFESGLQRTLEVSPTVQRIENVELLKSLVKMGEGWSVLPYHMVQQEIESGEFVALQVEELNTELRFPLAIWYMNESRKGPVRSLIIKKLGEHCK